LGASPTSSPLEGPPSEQSPPRTTSLRLARAVSATHDESPPRRTSLRRAQRVFAPHDKPLIRTSGFRLRLRRGPCHAARSRDANTFTATRGGPIPRAMQTHQLGPARAAGPDRGLNTALLGYAAVKLPSSPTLQHASSARGTQAPPTTSSGLRLGLNVAGSSSALASKLLGRSARRPGVNSPTRPRGGVNDNATQLHFNAS
jgi:hypothetical protein